MASPHDSLSPLTIPPLTVGRSHGSEMLVVAMMSQKRQEQVQIHEQPFYTTVHSYRICLWGTFLILDTS